MSSLYLVDDHQIMRDGLRALLESRGHVVVGESSDPTHALADLLRLRPEVLLLDLNLGGRSGLELLAEVQRRQLPLRTVVLTMSAQPHQVAEGLRLGASGYVLKGSPSSELIAAIDAAVKGKRYLGTDVADLALEAFTQAQDVDPLSLLSPRERQIIVMVVDGLSSSAIGIELHLSPKTVATYRSRLMKKLAVSDVPSLVRLAVRHKLVDSGDQGLRNRRVHDA
ncbi:MAG: response regulator transcription factor [Rhodoferax sp.]|uniref:response regulator n=1 Tax=Rhodoferax sp. TaxID=50421 RepID=UPI0026043456|nr:response regulator transcription factor [Rhodoferax sp.]MDD2883043.1 response regulator transcription factor [Rhodoferax sp.]